MDRKMNNLASAFSGIGFGTAVIIYTNPFVSTKDILKYIAPTIAIVIENYLKKIIINKEVKDEIKRIDKSIGDLLKIKYSKNINEGVLNECNMYLEEIYKEKIYLISMCAGVSSIKK